VTPRRTNSLRRPQLLAAITGAAPEVSQQAATVTGGGL